MNKKGYIYENSDTSLLRKNVILLGDKPEDWLMAIKKDDKQCYHDTIVNIGYLNPMPGSENLFEEYSKHYDIVITGDGPMLPLQLILNWLTEQDLSDLLEPSVKVLSDVL